MRASLRNATRDLNALQLFTARGNRNMLRMRYVNLCGLRAKDARRLWQNHARGSYAPRA